MGLFIKQRKVGCPRNVTLMELLGRPHVEDHTRFVKLVPKKIFNVYSTRCRKESKLTSCFGFSTKVMLFTQMLQHEGGTRIVLLLTRTNVGIS
mmetsp:Transcript_156961/g.273259  ORF Transcript_156961/g.273259 Transcript_156961/m.273259 type:complete len:93 (+) Transcript_156961:1001-1279(+)